MAVRIAISTKGLPIRKWRRFADENNIDKRWQIALEQGHDAGNWYVCTEPISVDNIVEIYVSTLATQTTE